MELSPTHYISIDELDRLLSLSIKFDRTNKLLTFLSCLSAFTNYSQFNVMLSGQSSSGKSYIALEIASIFPEKYVIEIAHASPMAFYHEQGKFDKDKNMFIVDLHKKIIVFHDQAQPNVIVALRPILSHDKDKNLSMVADPSQKGGTKTKKTLLDGIPAVIYCSANMRLDEQELNRFVLLSPEINQEKIRSSCNHAILKVTNPKKYNTIKESDPGFLCLKQRIKLISEIDIDDISIHDPELFRNEIFKRHERLQPRLPRDITKMASIIKSLALLNFETCSRDMDNDKIFYTCDADIENGFKLWDTISAAQNSSLPPQILEVFNSIIKPLCQQYPTGISYEQIKTGYFQLYETTVRDHVFKRNIIYMLEDSGKIQLLPDQSDKRKILVSLCEI
jgi:hypothetical protein